MAMVRAVDRVQLPVRRASSNFLQLGYACAVGAARREAEPLLGSAAVYGFIGVDLSNRFRVAVGAGSGAYWKGGNSPSGRSDVVGPSDRSRAGYWPQSLSFAAHPLLV